MTAADTRQVYVEGISFWAPRLPGWEIAAAVLAGNAEPPAVTLRRPSPAILPSAERRRAPDSVALAIEVAARACGAAALDPRGLPSVFATTHGDPVITDYLCETLVKTPLHTSPTKFHNSVHNAAAGYWCIASGCHAPYTTVSVFGYSYAAGLLETIMQVGSDGGSALYVAYDIESCGPLAPFAVSRGLLGVGLVIASNRSARTVARLSWSFRSGGSEGLTQAKPANASLLEGNAMAPCLPLFEALARGAGPVTLALGPRMLLDIVVQDARTLPP